MVKRQPHFASGEIKIFIDDLRVVCGNHDPFAIFTSDVRNLLLDDAISLMGHSAVGQIAADGGGICFSNLQCVSTETKRGDFHLRNRSIRQDLNGLRAGLPGVGGLVGVAMIKDIPLPIHPLDAAMVGASGVEPVLLLASLVAYIAARHDGSAVDKIPVRIAASGIAQLMPQAGRIDEIIGVADFADGTGFEEGMLFKRSTFHAAGHDVARL